VQSRSAMGKADRWVWRLQRMAMNGTERLGFGGSAATSLAAPSATLQHLQQWVV
jgi:hypothetical protein